MKDKCKDCTNDKGCINCEDGNMHEVKKKKPEGALKELLDNMDALEYEKTRREMKEYTPNKEFENFAKAYMEENEAEIIFIYDRYGGLKDGAKWLLERACKWWEDEFYYPTMTQEEIKWYKDKVNEFRKAMEI